MIKEDVQNGHLFQFPKERPILSKIEPDFDITWAQRILKFNTKCSVYFVKPKTHISQAFGFEQELVMAIFDYPKLEARSIQAIENFFQQVPAAGRVDQTVSLLISDDKNTENWIHDYTSRNPQTRAYVGIAKSDILNSNDDWFLRNKFSGQLFSRDLFDYTLPLQEDLFFFGRQAIVAEHIDAIRRSENRGLFGLRKTGKTSVLFKILRQCKENKIIARYYDCKLPSIYNLRGKNLLERIYEEVSSDISINSGEWRNKKEIEDRFVWLVKNTPDDKRFCIIFDEIEYISPSSKLAAHWSDDFVPFWQTIWSAQSQHRKFAFIVSGVNASMIEQDKIGGNQNPVFGIVKANYLTGFEKNEMRTLLRVFGRRMGMRFDESSLDVLFQRYGGHPLLTRMICSQINNEIKASNAQRPVQVTQSTINNGLAGREEEVQFYCRHIISELEEFYPGEFLMLEALASGDITGFNDLADDIDYTRHLRSYGLVDFSRPFEPKFKIPIIKDYIAANWKKRNNLPSVRYIVPAERRQQFVSGRAESILREMRAAEKKFHSIGLPSLYSQRGPSEAELFAKVQVCSSRDGMVAFLNQANRSLIEPLDRTGQRQSIKNYFYTTLSKSYPQLWPSLNRIRAYRNNFLHIDLNKTASEQYNLYLNEDLGGVTPENVVDGWFQLQSAVLNCVIIGLQAQIAVYD